MGQDSPADDEHRSLTRHTVHGIVWITAARFLKLPLNLIAIAILSRLLTPTDFGVVAIGTLVVTLSNVLVDGSFGLVLIQRRDLTPDYIGASFLLSFGLAVTMTIAVVAAAPFIEGEFGFAHLGNVLLVLAAALPINSITSMTTALMQRGFQFGRLTANAIVSQVAYTLVAIALAVLGFGLWSLVWAQVAQFVVDALLGLLAVRARYAIGFSVAALGETWRSGGMFTISKVLNWGANNVDNVMIGRFVGASALGFYSRAFTLMSTAKQLSGAGPIRVLFSSFAKMQDDPQRMARAYLRSLSAALIASTLVSAFVVVNAEVIVRVILGPRWLPTIPVLQLMFSAFVARSGYIVAEAIPLALGRSGQTALRQGAQLILVMSGAAIGAQFGLIPAVIGITAAYWIFYLLCLALVQQLIPVHWLQILRLHFKGVIVAALPVALSIGCREALGDETLFLELGTAAIFCLTALLVLILGPAALVGDDIAGARTHVWNRVSPLLPKPRIRA